MRRKFVVTGGFEFRINGQKVKSGDVVELDADDYITALHIGEGVLVEPAQPKSVKAIKTPKE